MVLLIIIIMVHTWPYLTCNTNISPTRFYSPFFDYFSAAVDSCMRHAVKRGMRLTLCYRSVNFEGYLPRPLHPASPLEITMSLEMRSLTAVFPLRERIALKYPQLEAL